MDDETSQITAQRRKRINRMKKAIIVTMSALIIVPIILCIILTVKVCSLENKLDELIRAENQDKVTALVSDNRKQSTAGNQNEAATDSKWENSSKEKSEAEKTADLEKETTVVTKEDLDKSGYGKTVCLTFDDGPSENTEAILDILDKYKVKATFFVIGNTDELAAKRYKEIVDRGHSIGLHSYSHDYEYIYASVDNFIEEVNKIHDLVYEATGVDTRLFRFPGGSANYTVDKIDIHDCIDYLNENGYTYFDWNVSSGDATGKEQTVEMLMKNIENDLYKFDTAVILMHDSVYKKTTVEKLPQLIEKLIGEGFEIKPIDESITKIQQIRDNK